ncbi:RidA family protein [Mycolicibacterium brisbanense]|uniref:Endoribonuclease L-PSP n=1 Tax=Mycolicibacterium brisbanense TaxID=146020 RepID=A0A100VVZ3_9MYCO|nr:RidA family protein [Mycolicibacterium brisbanense]MCV7159737.1 RidA family protein [Mycolicibacterium brisbanense]GAS87037.1 endoribonuclease L-PSP [Mycolicibacterium brisbanense]
MSTDPAAAPPQQGDYQLAVEHGGIVYTAGMTPRRDGVLVMSGVVGESVSAEQAYVAAGIAATNALTAVRCAAPGASNVRCLRMTVYIACAPTFHDLSAVADGASAVIRAAYGEAALPARAAIGVQSLPSGAPVEIDVIAAVS